MICFDWNPSRQLINTEENSYIKSVVSSNYAQLKSLRLIDGANIEHCRRSTKHTAASPRPSFNSVKTLALELMNKY